MPATQSVGHPLPLAAYIKISLAFRVVPQCGPVPVFTAKTRRQMPFMRDFFEAGRIIQPSARCMAVADVQPTFAGTDTGLFTPTAATDTTFR